ncbi:uncharacterized protein PHACADRAFT_254748 [Phanerochaete carnosa HHB-10118-sp]|uniref:Uncharacterized protein n=1 Tax=Phanerochaete carnosa (strain HHB-10118-sp) TaxID=650164 RepID=K5X2Y4_PHACS|nr:uncharacterized protein PHACADRAFT_254748 [Phanerochaete carnosa HHB-10118-sp]EKM57167.1 hypothetical protein PHACADRAFT_254748 [Phanerochaete carnosa HHB-10118-sp]
MLQCMLTLLPVFYYVRVLTLSYKDPALPTFTPAVYAVIEDKLVCFTQAFQAHCHVFSDFGHVRLRCHDVHDDGSKAVTLRNNMVQLAPIEVEG